MTHGATYTHSHTLRRVQRGKEHSLIIGAVQRQWECTAVTMVLLAASLEHHAAVPHSNTEPANHTHNNHDYGRNHARQKLALTFPVQSENEAPETKAKEWILVDMTTFSVFQSSHAITAAAMQTTSDTYAGSLAQQRTIIPTTHTMSKGDWKKVQSFKEPRHHLLLIRLS